MLGGVEIARERVFGLVDGLVEDGEVGPRCGVGLVELYGTDVCLQCVHRLVLLLVQNSANNKVFTDWSIDWWSDRLVD